MNKNRKGAILVLVMLVLLVLATLMLQIWFSTDVDRQIALYQKNLFPLRQAAHGAFMKACSSLLQDLEGNEESGEGTEEGLSGEESATEAGASEESGAEGLGGMAGAGGGMGEESASPTDSLVDSWARPGSVSMVFSNEVEAKVLIRDEDAKFNVLSLLAEDEEFAEASMDRLVRLIDNFRDGTRGDLSHGDARDIAGAMKDWMEGEREADIFPRPLIKTGAMDKDLDDMEEEPFDLPLTVDEFMMCEGITKETLFGYVENRERIPGLLEYITIYSNLIMDEPKEDEEDDDSYTDSDPFNNEEEDDSNQTPEDEEEGDTGQTAGEEESVETNNGLINVNTAPFPVLKALIDRSELSYSVLDQVEEFREKAMDVFFESMEDDNWGMGGDRFGEDDEDKKDKDSSGGSDDAFDFGDKEDEDFIFTTPEEIFDRVSSYFDTDFDIDKDAEEEFLSLLTVTSNVFTIYITVKTSDDNLAKTYRAVVWRRKGATSGEGEDQDLLSVASESSGQIVILVPLEVYAHPIPYREGEEENMEEEYSY